MCKCALSVQHHWVPVEHGTSPLRSVWVAMFTHVPPPPPSASSCTTAVSPTWAGLQWPVDEGKLRLSDQRTTLNQTEPTPTTRGARKEIDTSPISAVPI